jgi:hypothetical protein
MMSTPCWTKPIGCGDGESEATDGVEIPGWLVPELPTTGDADGESVDDALARRELELTDVVLGPLAMGETTPGSAGLKTSARTPMPMRTKAAPVSHAATRRLDTIDSQLHWPELDPSLRREGGLGLGLGNGAAAGRGVAPVPG